jgi:hypothetical protein
MYQPLKAREYGGGRTGLTPFMPEGVFIGDRTTDCRGTENNPIMRK